MTSTYDLLARQKVIAEFAGIRHIPCRFMTALCPDRCGHAKDVAVFNVTKVEEYYKPGKYGDDEYTQVMVNLKGGDGTDKQDPEIIAKVNTLTKGAKVRLIVEHIYVHNGGMHYPERPVRSIEIL